MNTGKERTSTWQGTNKHTRTHTYTLALRILSQCRTHFAWLVYWVGCIAAVVVIASCAKGKLPKIILRKFFHFAAVAMFVPAWLVGVCVFVCVCVCVRAL